MSVAAIIAVFAHSVLPCSQRGRTLWVDMESSLRTLLKDDTDVFDVNKAMACVQCILELGLAPKG